MTVRWQSSVDFVVLAVAIYALLQWSREARAMRLALIILAIRLGALLTSQLGLLITTWVLDAATVVALLVLVVAFQPELRRALMRLDPPGRAARKSRLPVNRAVATAAFDLAKVGRGALIVIVRANSIAELVTGGVATFAAVSAELLEAIFQKDSPLHDGAAIVDNGQIARAGVILPLTQRPVPDYFGTRHRAGLGLSERSDAIVIVVSEERGTVTVMSQGHASLTPDSDTLVTVLTSKADEPGRGAVRGRSIAPRTAVALGAVSLALSAIVWSTTFLLPGQSVQVETVPLEFVNLPPGLKVSGQSVDSVQVWLRATDFVLASANLSGLVARVDLSHAHTGTNVIPSAAAAIDTAPGIKVERLVPPELQVRVGDARSLN